LFDEALREFRRVLELVPEDRHARFHLGLIALRRASWADAAEALGEVVARPDAPAAAYHALAIARAAIGDRAAAVEALDEAARRGLGDDVRLRIVRASLQLASGEGDVAATLGDATPESSADAATRAAGAPWYHYTALAAARRGDAAAATAALEQGVAAYPHAAGLLANLAALRLRAGRPDEALRLANAALAEDPSLGPVHKTAGDAHYRAGRYDDALRCYERAIAAAPSLGPDVHLRAGNVHLRRGERPLAAASWRRVLEIEPGHVIARGNLAALEREGAA
jgi:tetratricopeptide (TPR) repeat protein